MKRVLVLISMTVIMCCKHRSSDLGEGSKKIDPEDFLAMFNDLALPVSFSDSNLTKKPLDSPLSWTIYSQFLADTLIQKNFGKTSKPRLFAAGKLRVKKGETYLFIKAMASTKKVIYVACLDKDGNFQTGMPLVLRNDDGDIHYTSVIDNKYAISVSRSHKDEAGKTVFVRTVYVYNAEGVFTLIMRESNEGKPRNDQIYNPVDTLPRKHKYTGDYIQDKRNFISVRDGKNDKMIRFFVHFEKDNGKCKGELKGEARFVSSGTARYIATGDPCSLEFTFTDKTVRMKELEGCGNHRDIRCYFEGLFNKQKETPAKAVKPKRRQV